MQCLLMVVDQESRRNPKGKKEESAQKRYSSDIGSLRVQRARELTSSARLLVSKPWNTGFIKSLLHIRIAEA